MPIFIFNKLVRDKLVKEFENKNQKAIYRSLSLIEHINALKQKIIEEANEIPVDTQNNDFISELADVQQALDDLRSIAGVTNEQVSQVQKKKFDKKGGFLNGTYVETIELQDSDTWLDYYRAHPEQFHEISESDRALVSGIYKHYKGNKYRVIGVGKDTETDEDVVIYQPLYDTDIAYWVRPLSMFCDSVTIDGQSIARFTRLIDET